MTVTDFPDYATSQDRANKIATTGAPLLALKTIIAQNQLGLSIGASSTVNITPNASLSQISYELLLILATTAGTATPVTVVVEWSDSVTGQVTDSQTWTMFAGASLTPHNVRITGPSNADTLNTFVKTGANGITLFFTALQSSRVYSRHLGHTLTTNLTNPVFPGFTFASSDMAGGVIQADGISVPASGSAVRLLPLYSGTARWTGRSGSSVATDTDWRISYSALLYGFGDAIAYIIQGGTADAPFGAGSFQFDDIALPRSQMLFQATNHNTTTAETEVSHLVAREITT